MKQRTDHDALAEAQARYNDFARQFELARRERAQELNRLLPPESQSLGAVLAAQRRRRGFERPYPWGVSDE